VNQNQNGIVSEEEFRHLMTNMHNSCIKSSGGMFVLDGGLGDENSELQGNIDSLLDIIDPFNNQKMTYSEVVQLLSQQMVNASSGTHAGNDFASDIYKEAM